MSNVADPLRWAQVGFAWELAVPVPNRALAARFSKMEADLYDEFGNYIGPELDSDEESEDEDEIGEEEVAEYVSRVGFWT